MVCLCLFDQGVSGLLVTFVCETTKLIPQVSSGSWCLVSHQSSWKNCYDFEYFLISDFLRCFEHLDFGQNTLTYDICFWSHKSSDGSSSCGMCFWSGFVPSEGSKLRLVMASQSDDGNKLRSDLSCIQASKCEWTCSWIWLEAIRCLHSTCYICTLLNLHIYISLNIIHILYVQF